MIPKISPCWDTNYAALNLQLTTDKNFKNLKNLYKIITRPRPANSTLLSKLQNNVNIKSLISLTFYESQKTQQIS